MTRFGQTRRDGQTLFGFALFGTLALFGASAVWIARDFYDGTPHSAALMPMLAGGTVACLSVWSMFNPRSRVEPLPRGTAFARPVLATLGTFAFLFLMPLIGYPIVAPLWLAGLMLLLGERRYPIVAAVSIVLPGIAWVLLSRLAFAPPPLGPLEHLIGR